MRESNIEELKAKKAADLQKEREKKKQEAEERK